MPLLWCNFANSIRVFGCWLGKTMKDTRKGVGRFPECAKFGESCNANGRLQVARFLVRRPHVSQKSTNWDTKTHPDEGVNGRHGRATALTKISCRRSHRATTPTHSCCSNNGSFLLYQKRIDWCFKGNEQHTVLSTQAAPTVRQLCWPEGVRTGMH